jgi:hypothetical protein
MDGLVRWDRMGWIVANLALPEDFMHAPISSWFGKAIVSNPSVKSVIVYDPSDLVLTRVIAIDTRAKMAYLLPKGGPEFLSSKVREVPFKRFEVIGNDQV